ncbi:MAG: GGDEF domain-containing protein [Bacteroides sp.]|nr:GGDEF domain-containing protein [Bacteroides sp.]
MKKYRSPIFAVLFIIVTAALAFVCCYDIFFSGYDSFVEASELNVTWHNNNGIEIDTDDRSKLSAIIVDNKYSLYHTVAKDNPNAYVSFKNSFSETKILLNDRVVYSTDENSDRMEHSLFPLGSVSPQLHIAELGSIKKGDVITISVNMYYGSDPYSVSDIMLGNLDEVLNEVFKSDLFGIALCVALLALGIVLIVFSFVFRKAVSVNGIHYAGIFSILACVYAGSESVAVSALGIVSSDALYIIQKLTFATMILPIIMFFMENTKFRSTDKFLRVASILQVSVITLIYILGITGIADLHQTETFAELVMLVQLILIFAALVFDLSKKNEKRSEDLTLIIVYLIFVAGLVLQFSLNIGSSIPLLFALSSLFFTAAVLIIRLCDFAKAMELSTEVEAMGKIAFTDGLTGVGNTAAFKKKLNHLEVVKVNYQSIGIVQFDINNLKTINDTLGHEMGDKLITDGSAMINKYFGNVGDVYRTGGDEFVAVVCCDNAFKLCNEAIFKFEMAINEYNADKTHRFMLQIAYGAEFYRSDSAGQYLTLREVQKLADKKMYEKKRELKEMAKREGLEVIRTNAGK